jgi:uncharacterized protein YkwD
MTLQTVKKRPTRSHHKKLTGQHHKHSRHYVKAYWPYLPVFAVLGLGILLNSWISQAHRSVLGYATDMSVQSLLDDTNQQRSANGESGLGLNAQLNQAAQAKANDMAARDYWSHNTPDGQAPWTFITAAGYSYKTAGENLAYGFATASDTLNGWMNSPGHRANVLNTGFSEVGFGIINIANYQGSGPQTLVVAMYAAPYSAPVAAAAPAPKSPAAPVTTSTQQSDTSSSSAGGSSPPASSDTLTPATNQPTTITAEVKPPKSPEPTQRSLTRVQLVSRSQLGMYGITLLALALILAFAFRHVKAWHRVLVRGEHFVLRHPGLDAAGAAVLVVCLLLGQSSGLIR